MAEETFTFRVDGDLKHAFTAIARKKDRNGSLLLREYMRRIVESDGRDLDAPATSRTAAPSTLTATERDRREKAVAYGQASTALEGLPVPPEAHDLAERFIAGELSVTAFAAARHGGGHDR